MGKINLTFNFENIWLGASLFISAGAVVYFLYAFNVLGLIASLLIAGILYWGLRPSLKRERATAEKTAPSFLIYAALSLLLDAIAVFLAISGRTDKAIISPWTQISPWFFPIFAAASLALIAALSRPAKTIYKKLLLAAYYFISFSVAAIVYRLGYGFDPFIHQATMAQINQDGYILPKTPYYLGQYSLIIALHKLSGLSLFLINRWLLPILGALTLPCLLPYFHQGRENKKSAWLASLLLLLLGASPFIMTTPQSFSYLLLIATVIFVYKQTAWPLSLVSAAAAFAIHPLAGIPALLLVGWELLRSRQRTKIAAYLKHPSVIFITSTLVLCLALWAIAGFGGLRPQTFDLSLFNPSFANSESYFLNLSYFLIHNYVWLIIGGALIIFFNRRRFWTAGSKEAETARLLALNALAALSAYLISRGFDFANLIVYEQANYAARLPIIALILLLPLYWELLYRLCQRVLIQERWTRNLIAIGAALMLAVAVYASYPRLDNYYNSRGYSTSATDVAAVHQAEDRANHEAYIVLANQQVSAAALREFGFRGRYIKNNNGEFYFYPIPTGERLYQYFLDMVYKQAARETMIKAMDFAGVNRAYLIINRYWWASDKIVAEAKISADYWEKINQGEAYLFEYRR